MTAIISQSGSASGHIRVGIGGWTYPEWRGVFYPEGLKQDSELEYASSKVTAIEINGTFYRTQKRESFADWRDRTPDNFIFSLKAPRYATNRKELATAGESIERFVNSGIDELGHKLGPLLWEFSRFKKFEAEDFEGFLKLLPAVAGRLKLRHVLDVRHATFAATEFIALARKYNVACVYTDAHDLPSFADRTADFVYARMMEAEADRTNGYSDESLDKFAEEALAWSQGALPNALPYIDKEAGPPAVEPTDVFIYMINGAKERAPAAAMALIERLSPSDKRTGAASTEPQPQPQLQAPKPKPKPKPKPEKEPKPDEKPAKASGAAATKTPKKKAASKPK